MASTWTHDEAGGFIFRARPSRSGFSAWYGEAKRASEPFTSDDGGLSGPFDQELWFSFGASAEEVFADLKAEVLS